MNFVEELTWRGMIHDIMPGTQDQLEKEMTTAYVGIDPTADSLHIGHLVSIMLLKHLQRAGHKPIVVVGGATGMIGDPSGKSEERNLLSLETLIHNQEKLQIQLGKFLDFSPISNKAELVNNYDWVQPLSFLDFIRDVGKHITVNYMLSKDSVKKRLETGISFTEFSYQLVQGYDFLYLFENKGCKLQMGGSDQWGNITTGTELIRRKLGKEAYALTCPLITKSDGGKFGKTEKGNIWLSSDYTSPYQFYQFWMNVTDEDAEKYIKIFTLLTVEEINQIIEDHKKAPHLRIIQKTLSKEVTTMVHSSEDYNLAFEASQVLFGKGTLDSLKKITESDFLSIFEGVPLFKVDPSVINHGVLVVDLLTQYAPVFESKGEMRRLIDSGGLYINKEKVGSHEEIINFTKFMNNKFLIIQKGKKNYYLIKI